MGAAASFNEAYMENRTERFTGGWHHFAQKGAAEGHPILKGLWLHGYV